MAGNDTSTTLNPATVAGGSVMDESAVTQSDGVTAAHRTRVALGLDDGRLVGQSGDNAHVPVEELTVQQLLLDIRDELREIKLMLIGAIGE